MKNHLYLFTLLCILGLSCSDQPRHPQAILNNPTTVTESSILSYADSLDKQLPLFEQENSLIYQSANRSIHVEKYSFNGQAIIYNVQTTDPGPIEKTSSYYFKNDSLLLVRDQVKKTKDKSTLFEELRSYLRNSVPFKTETRQAVAASALKQAVFQEQQQPGATDYRAIRSDLDDAISGSNKYEMVFEQFIAGPDEKFISLKSKLPGVYTASVQVADTDGFSDSLEHFPQLFKDMRLKLKTKTAGNESIYVPVSRNVTSASGLNR